MRLWRVTALNRGAIFDLRAPVCQFINCNVALLESFASWPRYAKPYIELTALHLLHATVFSSPFSYFEALYFFLFCHNFFDVCSAKLCRFLKIPVRASTLKICRTNLHNWIICVQRFFSPSLCLSSPLLHAHTFSSLRGLVNIPDGGRTKKQNKSLKTRSKRKSDRTSGAVCGGKAAPRSARRCFLGGASDVNDKKIIYPYMSEWDNYVYE